MLCQKCQERPANVHFTQVVNNHRTELYLCEQCAGEMGQLKMGAPININDVFSGFLGLGNALQRPTAQIREHRCEKCGMSFEDFQKTGKLGCGSCYEAFGEKLRPIIKRFHGNNEHTGKAPESISQTIRTSRELGKLKDSLNRAIQNEEYEKAAELRDQIKALEAESK